MNKRKIAITTGDTDGIGLEIAAKSLQRLGPQPGTIYFLFRHRRQSKSRWLRLLDRHFTRQTFPDLAEALSRLSTGSSTKKLLIDICSVKEPPVWVEEVGLACLHGKIDGMVTGPLSKTLIRKSGMKDLGHTDILKRISRTPNVHMGFLGKHFSVVLATAHIPLKDVTYKLNQRAVENALWAGQNLRKSLPPTQRRRPLGLLGVNPHAGEDGLLGREERVLRKAAAKLRLKSVPVKGPLVPDAAFLPRFQKKYSVYIACYHDQGLIPFKMAHGSSSGVHISLGLPFIRTSVDHGTAKDIFKLGIADPGSMYDAIQWCSKLSRQRKVHVRSRHFSRV